MERHRIRLGDASFDAGVLSPREGESFGSSVLDVLADRVPRDHLTILPGDLTQHFGSDFINWGKLALLDSIGMYRSAAAIDLALLDHRLPNVPSPVLVGSSRLVRFVCSYMAEPLPPQAIVDSTPLRRDFSVFSHLWSGDRPEDPASGPFRRMDGMAMGKVLGKFHSKGHLQGSDGVVWMDGHRDNFLLGVKPTGDAMLVDVGEHGHELYRPASAALCATMLVPLLSQFDSAEYSGFRNGYILSRGDAGRDVFYCIQDGDRTGYMRALAAEDYALAAERIQRQLLDSPESDPNVDARWMLGKSFTRLARYDDAELSYNEVLEYLEPNDWRVAFLHASLGELHKRSENFSRAAQEYAEVIRLAPENQRSLIDLAHARLTELGALPDDPNPRE